MSKMFLGLLITMILPCAFIGSALSADPVQKEFSGFYSDFQNAVKSGDKDKVAALADFDGFTWEANESLQQNVKTKEAFVKNYDKMFTSEIKSRIAKSKPAKIDDNSYFINWHTKSLEYSLYFARQGDGGFRFLGLTVGPY